MKVATVGVVCVKDNGSQSRKAIIDVAGVPAQGLFDTAGANNYYHYGP